MSHYTFSDRILRMIDEELDRLLQAREILIAYAKGMPSELGKPKPKRKRRTRPALAETSVSEVKVTIVPPATEPKRRQRAVKLPQVQPNALASRYPTSPVFVAPAKDARPEVQQPLVPQPLSDFGARVQAEERNLVASRFGYLGMVDLKSTDTSQ